MGNVWRQSSRYVYLHVCVCVCVCIIRRQDSDGFSGEDTTGSPVTKAINRPPYCLPPSSHPSLAVPPLVWASTCSIPPSLSLSLPNHLLVLHLELSSSHRGPWARQVASLEIAFLIYNRATVRPLFALPLFPRPNVLPSAFAHLLVFAYRRSFSLVLISYRSRIIYVVLLATCESADFSYGSRGLLDGAAVAQGGIATIWRKENCDPWW